MLTRSSTAPEVAGVYARARELAQAPERFAALFTTVFGSWMATFSRGDLETPEHLVDELFDIARKADDPGLMLQAHHAAWPTVMSRGKFAKAWQHVQAGLGLYRREMHGQHAYVYGGHDPGMCAYTCGALVRVILGYPDHALELIDKGLALARDLDHPPTLVHALWFAAEVRQLRREPRAVEEIVAALAPLVSEHGSAVGVANTTMLRGWAQVATGEIDQGIAELRKGTHAWRATGSRFHFPYRLARAADAYRMAGLRAEGLHLVTEALEATERSGEGWFDAELHRLRGELLSRRDGVEAEGCFHRALVVARNQGARYLELRAATSLARLWCDQSRRDESCALLAPVYAWFTEGFETPDLRDANVLLDALR
jgi:predicted ATPase